MNKNISKLFSKKSVLQFRPHIRVVPHNGQDDCVLSFMCEGPRHLCSFLLGLQQRHSVTRVVMKTTSTPSVYFPLGVGLGQVLAFFVAFSGHLSRK